MSVFSPTAWLTRSRLASSSTADFSKDGSLEGLKYIQSQSSSQTQGAAPISNYSNQNYIHSSNPVASHDRFLDDRAAGHRRNINGSSASASNSNGSGGDFYSHIMLDQEDLGPNHRDRNETSSKANKQNNKWTQQPENDVQDEQVVLQDSFQADVSLSSREVRDLVKTQREENLQPRREKTITPTCDGSLLRNVGSFGNVSCISSLSADETHYDQDDKTAKSLENHGSKGQDVGALNHGHGRGRRSSSKGDNASKGRDFGGAFDHLDHLIEPKDLLDDDMGDHDESPDALLNSLLIEDSFHPERSRNYPYLRNSEQQHQQHRRAQTFVSTTKLLSERPKPLQQRASSDYFTLDKPRPLSQLQRSTSIGSRTAVSNTNHSSQHQRQPSQPVAAHATLRECICISKANNVGESTGHKRLLSTAQMPQLLAVRSTSLTVQSSTANTVASSSGGVSGGVVWNGQPIYDLTVPPPSPSSTRGSHSRNSSIAMGGAISTVGHALDGYTDANNSRVGHVSRHSAGSGTSFLSYDAYSGHRSFASSANVYSTSSDCRSTIAGNALEHSQHHRAVSGDVETTLIKELQLASIMDDKTAVSSSMESGSFNSPSNRRRKPSLKDEMKFILKKMVPTPLRKVAVRKSKVNLERSSGCLT
mmetsp:Transcript_12483/g.23420  ORF Transcript_12483/g.23420 Transcript_12483/m.23420 type:complete len:647 (+) Transcript_12483:1052-2992(+)